MRDFGKWYIYICYTCVLFFFCLFFIVLFFSFLCSFFPCCESFFKKMHWILQTERYNYIISIYLVHVECILHHVIGIASSMGWIWSFILHCSKYSSISSKWKLIVVLKLHDNMHGGNFNSCLFVSYILVAPLPACF